MRPLIFRLIDSASSFPRVSGDAPAQQFCIDSMDRFSPRERGCAPRVLIRVRRAWVFPA